MKLTLDHSEAVNETIKTFWFRPERSLNYIAGQYAEIALPHEQSDNRGLKRWFTLFSSPSEPLLAITTRQGKSSFKRALWQLQPGASVTSSEALGDFVLPKDPGLPLLFVVAGIGITPVRSMIKWLADQGEKRSIHVLYGVHKSSDAVFTSLLTDYGAHVEIVAGRLDAEFVMAHFQQNPQQMVFVSGPEPMVDSLHQELFKLGLPAEQFVRDGFEGYIS